MTLQILREVLQNKDHFGYIRAGSHSDSYDLCAGAISPELSKDLSIDQIQNILWDAFYYFICFGTIGNTGEPFSIERKDAEYYIGPATQFKDLAFDIRHKVLGI